MNIKINKARTVIRKWTGVVLLAQVGWLLVHGSNPAFAQNPSLTATPTPVDEVYRIVIVKDVGDKEGRDNRLMLETLGYIPVHMLGDFGSGKGTVLLGNFPTQKEAQKMKEQLVRDGFLPLDIVRIKDGPYTILVDLYDQEEVAEKIRRKLIAAGMLQVNAFKDMQSGKYLVTVGAFRGADEARATLMNLKNVCGQSNAKIVESNNLTPVVPLEVVSSPRELTPAEIKAALLKISAMENTADLPRDNWGSPRPIYGPDVSPNRTETEKKYDILKDQALKSAKLGTVADLLVAKSKWEQILVLDGVYKSEAESRINALNKRIKKLNHRAIVK